MIIENIPKLLLITFEFEYDINEIPIVDKLINSNSLNLHHKDMSISSNIIFHNNIILYNQIENQCNIIPFIQYEILQSNFINVNEIHIYDTKNSKIFQYTNIQYVQFELLKKISIATKLKINNIKIIYDFETTGLIKTVNGNKILPEITERHLECYNYEYVFSTGLVKINKQYINQKVVDLTGITKELTEQGDSLKVFAEDIKNIFRYCNCPTFIAHNGSRFDHLILMNIMNRCGSKYNFVKLCRFEDTMKIIPSLMMHKPSELNLSYLYREILNKQIPDNVHRAKADVLMLIEILVHLNYKA